MLAVRDVGPIDADERLDGDALADRLELGRKKRRYAYLAWLGLGSHYVYLGRPVVQLLFWLTLGGLLFWWIADFFRLSALVERRNLRAARTMLRAWEAEHLHMPRAAPWPVQARPFEPAEPAFDAQPALVEAPAAPALAPAPGRVRIGAAAALAASLLVAFGTALFSPPQFYPRNFSDPSYRTVRQVNAREAPTTKSPIRASIERGVVLTGEVEDAASGGSTRWLRVTRGQHEDRYVALSNLERY